MGEQLHIVNVSNGSRAVTYAIEGHPAQVGLNGAMAHIGGRGDIVIIIAYAQVNDAELATHRPLVVLVDARQPCARGGGRLLNSAIGTEGGTVRRHRRG